MAEYLIHESNMERLEKKLATIQKKAAASNCAINYSRLGEEFRKCKDKEGNEYTAKYYKIDVSGEAKYNGWRFVATLDHHTDGNVIRAYDLNLEIPDKYKTCGPTCEHCNKIRSRKDTYLIYNEEKGEFKQVGKSCLQEFTNGLSAENVAFFCSVYEACESGYSYSGTSFNRYIVVEDILRYAFECYKYWGYQKSDSSFIEDNGYLPAGYRSTRDRVLDYFFVNRALGKEKNRLKAEMAEVGFNPSSDYAVEVARAALEWIRNEDPKNEYLRNLKVICSEECTDLRSLGILVSLTVSYARHLEQIEEHKKLEKAQEELKKSEHVGEVGDRLEIATSDFHLVSSWDGMYGTTWLYKFTDGTNVFSWFSSKAIDNEEDVVLVKGAVKSHSEYNGVSETVLTRCKVTHKPKEQEQLESYNSNEVEKAIDEFLSYCNS